ncbi:extracellular solute-binding protein [Leifsonia shinshuensis]|uniref:extracellular solute-binding protein n=1 Tax=Leifsonia TaxID=110932 RepID=UPI0028558122|nr:extracellular solute-binding protein [Leifsonia shinshuensis]MDR6971630.1 raffinose/stachyose/melibiose transport system substrate-binding protein [Leifsonia shinshuensis]
MKKQFTALAVGALAAATAVLLAGCAPGSSPGGSGESKTAASKSVESGKYTLTVWDQNNTGDIDTAQKKLNAAFEKKYPNITIKRNSQSFSDLKTTLKLALSGNNPPDVVQANQGYPDMGAFVSGGMLTPLDDYSTLYGWKDYFPSNLLALNTFSSDGKHWQTGNLYGVSNTGEFVGVYYNKKILSSLGVDAPKTLDDLTADMAKAKAAGIQPMAYGDLEKVRGIQLYGVVQAATAGATAVQDLVSAKSGAWTDKANVDAAATIQDWSKKGYLPADANGISQDAAVADFGKGKAAFIIDGTWDMSTIGQALGQTNAGMAALTPAGASAPVTQGGEGLAWAITSKSAHPNAAAAYIDFISGKSSAQTMIDANSLPTVLPADHKAQDGSLQASVYDQYTSLTAGKSIVPYLDYTTPTFYNTLTAAMQDLTAQKSTPQQFTQTLQTDYSGFVSGNK